MSWVVTCSECGKSAVYESGQGVPEVCPACAEKGKKEVKQFVEKEQKRKEMVAVGSSEFAQRKIKSTLGIVSGEQIFGVDLPKDLNLEKFNRGIALSWTEKVKKERDACIRAIEDDAMERGGNAVIGIDLSYEALGIHNDMVMILIAARGTAVIVE
ncbi:MAG: hypothetical protein EHM36_05135 [Deltaproteobacteria bacterium]|nr:MAG: hypothetical protein EHM36_05135 [Deltaproteobacteria bacterium]